MAGRATGSRLRGRPDLHPRKNIRDSLRFALSQYAVRAVMMARGIIGARLLGPGGYGAWNALLLLLEYGIFSQLGTQQGLDQIVPARIVESDHERLERIKRAGLFNVVVLSSLFSMVVMLYFLRSTGALRGYWGMKGIALVLLCAFLVNLGNYLATLLRSHGEITSVSVWYVVQALAGAGLGIALLPWLGAWGLLWGWLIGTLCGLSYARWKARGIAPLRPKPSVDSRTLLAIGFPMFFYLVSNLTMRSVDRIIILKLLGTEALGFYSLSIMLLTFMLHLPDSVLYVLYPQMVRRFRASGNAPEAIRGPVERPLRALSLMLPLLSGIAFFCSPAVIHFLLPKFASGIPALRIACFGPTAVALANLAAITLMTLGRHLYLVPAAIAMTVLGAVLDYLAVSHGYGIAGVALATLVTFVVNGATLVVLVQIGLFGWQPARIVRTLGLAYIPLGVSLGLAWALDRLIPGWGQGSGAMVGRMLVQTALFVGLYVAITHPLERGLGLKQIALELNLRGFLTRRAEQVESGPA